MEKETQQPDLDSFDDFSGKFIRAENIKDWPVCFIPISADSHFDEDENSHVVYTGEVEGKRKQWEPNKTNMQLLRQFGLKSPRALIGQKVWFKKVMNRNPNTKQLVASLEVEKLEQANLISQKKK